MTSLQKTGVAFLAFGVLFRFALIIVPACAPCAGEICPAICKLYLPFMILTFAYKVFLVTGTVFLVVGRRRT